ncbi:18 kDa antigen [Mycobacterium sp. MFM001]|uniref:Hsp20/alpha crystallin family protein n=1 Tax=Mycobacterium sp. MFM001 TaxID=2049453 RepID=UPI000DA54783|nr:HSP20 family small heat-shock protein [Mycobacterium sp. MFM001]GBE65549.1 18 kDa antigen [Mycobacterium sp. MFM001]
MVLVRADSSRELDRLTRQLLGTAARPAAMPMDAWRDGEKFVIELDLPGMKPDSLDLNIERNVLTVRAERPGIDQAREVVAAERPRGVFSRRLFLGENLDTDKIVASYRNGVLRLTIPVSVQARPRRIEINRNGRKPSVQGLPAGRREPLWRRLLRRR